MGFLCGLELLSTSCGSDSRWEHRFEAVMIEKVIAAFLIYRKFLKSSEIVYNGLEIKNDITKERRGLRHDVAYEVFCFGLG